MKTGTTSGPPTDPEENLEALWSQDVCSLFFCLPLFAEAAWSLVSVWISTGSLFFVSVSFTALPISCCREGGAKCLAGHSLEVMGKGS